MLSNNPAQPKASPSSDGQNSAAETPAALDPRSPIEVSSGGTGTVNDPSGTDNKPPGYGDLDLFA